MGQLWFISRGRGESRGEGMVGTPIQLVAPHLVVMVCESSLCPEQRNGGSKRKLEKEVSLGSRGRGGVRG